MRLVWSRPMLGVIGAATSVTAAAVRAAWPGLLQPSVAAPSAALASTDHGRLLRPLIPEARPLVETVRAPLDTLLRGRRLRGHFGSIVAVFPIARDSAAAAINAGGPTGRCCRLLCRAVCCSRADSGAAR